MPHRSVPFRALVVCSCTLASGATTFSCHVQQSHGAFPAPRSASKFTGWWVRTVRFSDTAAHRGSLHVCWLSFRAATGRPSPAFSRCQSQAPKATYGFERQCQACRAFAHPLTCQHSRGSPRGQAEHVDGGYPSTVQCSAALRPPGRRSGRQSASGSASQRCHCQQSSACRPHGLKLDVQLVCSRRLQFHTPEGSFPETAQHFVGPFTAPRASYARCTVLSLRYAQTQCFWHFAMMRCNLSLLCLLVLLGHGLGFPVAVLHGPVPLALGDHDLLTGSPCSSLTFVGTPVCRGLPDIECNASPSLAAMVLGFPWFA